MLPVVPFHVLPGLISFRFSLDFPAVFFYNTFVYPILSVPEAEILPAAETIRRLPVPRHPPLPRQFPVSGWMIHTKNKKRRNCYVCILAS